MKLLRKREKNSLFFTFISNKCYNKLDFCKNMERHNGIKMTYDIKLDELIQENKKLQK